MYVMVVYFGVLVELSTVGGGCVRLPWDPFAPIGLPCSGLILERVSSFITYSYSYVLLISLGVLLFFLKKNKGRGESSGERIWEGGRNLRNGLRRNSGSYVMYERQILKKC